MVLETLNPFNMRILFFAHLQALFGSPEIDLPVDTPVSTDRLWALLTERCPDLARHRATTRLARNQSFVGEETVFHPGDEVALIPPVSGG